MTFFALLLMTSAAGAKNLEPGLSLSLCDGKDIPTEAQLREIRDAGVRWVEVIMNPFTRYAPDDEGYVRAHTLKKRLDEAGLKVWSCHLPYGRSKSHNYDISVLDSDLREEALATDERMIALSAIYRPQRIVLHSSADLVPPEERPLRLRYARNSIGRLAVAVRETGAGRCVEVLPRACLGNCSEELLYLVGPYPEVMITFDVNHLLYESHEHFIAAAGGRIAHIHVSDYDGKDECHWVEGTGIIDWPALIDGLRKCGYRGVFMHEVRQGEGADPRSIVEAYKKIMSQKR